MTVRGWEQISISLRHAELGSASGVLGIPKNLYPEITSLERNGQVQDDGTRMGAKINITTSY